MQDWFVITIILFVVGICIYYYFINSDALQLKCVVSSVDGNQYCVRDREKVQDAADLLAKVTTKCKELVEYMKQKHPNDDRSIRLGNGFNPKKIMETLPTSSYTAYSENKGEKIAFCLSPKMKNGEDTLIDEHTLTFVAIHELAHVATKSVGHKTEFWENFKFLLENAKEAKIHEPRDYNKEPKKYCSMDIQDNPYYDM
tara:strand:+ start:141 stop:737 length:597 start_codon:yes stop_codon:yes gene_type:complete